MYAFRYNVNKKIHGMASESTRFVEGGGKVIEKWCAGVASTRERVARPAVKAAPRLSGRVGVIQRLTAGGRSCARPMRRAERENPCSSVLSTVWSCRIALLDLPYNRDS